MVDAYNRDTRVYDERVVVTERTMLCDSGSVVSLVQSLSRQLTARIVIITNGDEDVEFCAKLSVFGVI